MRFQTTSVIAVLLATVFAGAPAVAQHDASAETSAGAQQNVSAEAPLFTPQDLLFLHHMIMHHEQAVVMAPMVAEKSSHEDFIRFADYVGRAQAAEIGRVEMWRGGLRFIVVCCRPFRLTVP